MLSMVERLLHPSQSRSGENLNFVMQLFIHGYNRRSFNQGGSYRGAGGGGQFTSSSLETVHI